MLQPHLIIIPVSFLIFAALTWFCVVKADGDYDAASFLAIVSGLFAFCLLIAMIFAFAPYNAKYYFITAHTGVVSTVSNQFVNGSGDNTSQSFIVTLKGDDTPYELTDNRASVLDKKDVTLNCTTEFVWAGADRMNCVIGEVR